MRERETKKKEIASRAFITRPFANPLLAIHRTAGWQQRGDTIVNEWRVTRVGTRPISPAAGYAAAQQALCARCTTYAIVNAQPPRERVPPHFNGSPRLCPCGYSTRFHRTGITSPSC